MRVALPGVMGFSKTIAGGQLLQVPLDPLGYRVQGGYAVIEGARGRLGGNCDREGAVRGPTALTVTPMGCSANASISLISTIAALTAA
jgi:hypothetical protein